MGNRSGNWLDWGKRLRAHVKELNPPKTWTAIAEDATQAESTVRSWCNGTREINLSDFFKLCAAAKADPGQILFGRVSLSDEDRKRLGDVVVSILESDPSTSAHYGAMVGGIKKSSKSPTAKVARKSS